MREMKRNRRSWMIWTLSVVAVVLAGMAAFPAILSQAESLDKLMEQLPKSFMAAFGLSNMKMTDVLGYFIGKLYILNLLLGTIYATQLGAGILSKEEDDHTVDFLLSKPISRSAVVTQKGLAAGVCLALFSAAHAVAAILAFEVFKSGTTYSLGAALSVFLGGFLVNLLFAALGLVISVFVTRAKTVMPLSFGLVFGTYALYVMGQITDGLKWLKYLSPFYYGDPAEIVRRGSVVPLNSALLIGLALLFIVATLHFYQRKDITA
jgi:ABC-2 type transport system permease protein